MRDYTQAINLSPEDPSLYLGRGTAEQQLSNKTNAGRDFNTAASLPSANSRQIADSVRGLLEIGFYGDALTRVDSGLKAFEASWELHKYRADVEIALGNDSAAMLEFQEAIRLAGGSDLAFILNDRGSFLVQRGRYSAALADYDRAIALDSKDPWLYQGRATARLSLGNASLAESDLTRAISLFQSQGLTDVMPLVQVLEERARVYVSMGKKDSAVADLKQALSLNPDKATESRLRQFLASLGG